MDRERDKFVETNDGNTSVRVNLVNSIVNFDYDYVGVAYPDGVTEVYTFKIGGVSGDSVGVVTIVYSDASKEKIVSVARGV